MAYENYDPCFPDQPVVDRYLPIWAAQPSFRSKPAFIWADDQASTRTSITYSQLNSSVDAIASRLLLPLRRGDTVLVLCSPGLQLVKILFACQRAGLVAVPIIPPDPSSFSPPNQTPAHHHLLRAISQVYPNAAVAHPRYISAVRTAGLLQQIRWLSVDDLDNGMCGVGPAEYSGCGPEESYVIQYTSGATGTPKPVLVTAGAAAHNVRAARMAYDLQPSSVVVSWLPQYHDCGLMFLLLTVVAGATCVLATPTAFLRRPRIWLELVTEFRATCTPVPSFALPLVARRGGVERGERQLELGSLRNLILINEPIYQASVEAFVKEFASVGLDSSSISPSYGLAENCTFVSTAWRCNGSKNLLSHNKLLPLARLSPSDDDTEIEILVVDEETCEPVEDGVEGEIWVSSPSNASGYLGHPSLTREVFGRMLRGTTSRCFLRTGDRGVIRGGERYLYVVGRTSDVIRPRGHRDPVHPHYIETAAYNSGPERFRGGCIAAFGVRSPSSWRKRTEEEEAVVVVVVAELRSREGMGRDAGVYSKICEGMREGVLKEEGIWVGSVVLVESGSVPKTTSGKLRRWETKEKLLGGKLPVVFEVRYREYYSAPVAAVGEAGEGVGVEVPAPSFRGEGHQLSLVSCL